MTSSIDKLLSVGGNPLLEGSPLQLNLGSENTINSSLIKLLSKKNGFYAFESALHVFPSSSTNIEIGLDEWNHPSTWINEFNDRGDCSGTFFAEDVFGVQFRISSKGIFTFDPETSEQEWIANSLEEWACLILADYSVMTGYDLGHEWQKKNGRLPASCRLIPKTPFVLGGHFSTDNLIACERKKSMALRANLSNQIKNLSDGESIQWNIVP
jgi:hypothetical protein